MVERNIVFIISVFQMVADEKGGRHRNEIMWADTHSNERVGFWFLVSAVSGYSHLLMFCDVVGQKLIGQRSTVNGPSAVSLFLEME